MPVRSLNSSVITWPHGKAVDKAVREWGSRNAPRHGDLVRLGYFGSYATGNWGVGSDLDLVAIVLEPQEVFERRTLSWDLTALPVPTDMLIFTEDEWERLQKSGSRFARVLAEETVWIYERNDKRKVRMRIEPRG